MNTKYIKLKENQCLQGTAYWKQILEEKNFRATLDISGLKIQRRLIFCCFTQADTYEIIVEIIAGKSQIDI